MLPSLEELQGKPVKHEKEGNAVYLIRPYITSDKVILLFQKKFYTVFFVD